MTALTRNNKLSGFTIVELLIVIVVIAILAAISIVAYNGIQGRGRDAARSSDVRALQTALELYKADNGTYPQLSCVNCGAGAAGLSAFLVPTYLSKIPTDPDPAKWYSYVWGPVENSSYSIRVSYEAKPSCQQGVNMNAGWWGVPFC